MNYLNVSEEKSKIQFFSKAYPVSMMLLFFVLFSFSISCSDDQESHLSSVAQLESFSFGPTVNKDLEKVVSGKISGSNITATIPYGVSPDWLIA